MNKLCLVLGLGFVLLLHQSCKTAYTPNALNVPLLQERGEVKLLLSPTNYQAAYAVSDHVGIMANGYNLSSETTTEFNGVLTDSYTAKSIVGEVGVGYFGRTGRNFTYELYGGGGMTQASFRGTGAFGGKNYEVTGLKFFVQPNLGFVSQGFDLAFSPRLSGIQFGAPTVTKYPLTDLKNDNLDGLGNALHLFLEPALTLRAGYKYVKVQGQFGLSFQLSSGNIPYSPVIGNLGLAIDIARWYNR
jgi:hypothetical protein